MSTDEIDMIYEDARKYYKYYLMDWVNKNFNYASIKMMYLNQVNKNDDKLDPYNMYIDLVKKHAQSKKKAYQKEQKKEFFDELQSAVYEDLVKELKILDGRFYYFLHGLISKNRELSMQIVGLQQDLKTKYCPEDMYSFLLAVMTDQYDEVIIKESAEEMEKFISTQEEAIETLIYLWNIIDHDYKTYQSIEKYDTDLYDKIRNILSLAHVFILLYNCRKVYCSGKNYEHVLNVSEDGTISCKDALEYDKTTSTDYNYVFERDWMEYSNGYLEKMKAAFKRKYGFELDLMYAINVCVKKSQKDVLHFENKAELEYAFNNTFTVNVLDDLMKVFLFENIEEKKDLFVNLIAEKDKFHNKVLVEVDGKYILYKELAWQALQRYRCDVYVNPHRYFEDAFVTKITKNFEKALAEKLKAEFPGSYAITGIALNKFGFGGKRELDIIFVYGYSIHIIECKKIRMSESITEAIGSAGRARGEWNEQREEERKEYNICRIKLLTAYSEELGIELDNLSMYKEKFDLVTSETTLAHRDNDRRIFIIKDLINNIRAEAMHKDAPETQGDFAYNMGSTEQIKLLGAAFSPADSKLTGAA